MASVLQEPYFQDEGAALERLEAIVWPEGPVSTIVDALAGLMRWQASKTKRDKSGLPNVWPQGGEESVFEALA